MQGPFLIGERVYPCTYALDDAQRAMAWMHDRELTRTLETTGPITLEQERGWIRGSVSGTQVSLTDVVQMSIVHHEWHARRGR
jgi:phosphoribosyl-AMP cyclohydrolase